MKITGAESFLLRVPIGRGIADSMQFVTHLEFAGVHVATDAGISGTGYTITVGHGGSVTITTADLNSESISTLIELGNFDYRVRGYPMAPPAVKRSA